MPRRYADPYIHPYLEHLMPMNQFITVCAIVMGLAQLILVYNWISSIFWGPKAGRNPWNANGVEWVAPSPPPHGNFEEVPVVYRGPYEYSSPLVEGRDYLMQTDYLPPPETDDSTDSEDGPDDDVEDAIEESADDS
jgi:cytochrome c oxidase subunit 1